MPGEGIEGSGCKTRTAKMKPKFTCEALHSANITNIALADSAWVPRGAARGRARIGVDSCDEEQEKNEKTTKGQGKKPTAKVLKEETFHYPFAAEEGIAGQKPKGGG